MPKEHSLLDRIVGKQRNPVVRPETALPQKRGETANGLAQLAVADGAAVVGCTTHGLSGAANAGGDPTVQKV